MSKQTREVQCVKYDDKHARKLTKKGGPGFLGAGGKREG